MPSLSASISAVRNSFDACAFFENFQARKTIGADTLTRFPPGPAGSRPTCVFLNTDGFVVSVVRYAEIASWTQQPTPDARNRLSDASSQEKTSGVMPSSKSALANFNVSRISLESIAGLSPDASVSAPPKLNS